MSFSYGWKQLQIHCMNHKTAQSTAKRSSFGGDLFNLVHKSTLANVSVSHVCPFASYGPTGEVLLLYILYYVYFASNGLNQRVTDGWTDKQG